jgi:AmiR/NasT family two-component response regulator
VDGERARPSGIVYRAAGIITLQLGCSRPEAMEHLEAHALASRVELDALAQAVIDGSVRFDE